MKSNDLYPRYLPPKVIEVLDPCDSKRMDGENRFDENALGNLMPDTPIILVTVSTNFP